MRVLVFAAAVALATAGCNQLTAENYARVKVGMSYSEVTTTRVAPRSGSDCAATVDSHCASSKDASSSHHKRRRVGGDTTAKVRRTAESPGTSQEDLMRESRMTRSRPASLFDVPLNAAQRLETAPQNRLEFAFWIAR